MEEIIGLLRAKPRYDIKKQPIVHMYLKHFTFLHVSGLNSEPIARFS